MIKCVKEIKRQLQKHKCSYIDVCTLREKKKNNNCTIEHMHR